MTQRYPDVEGFAYSFARGELAMAGRIFTAISNVSADQPTEEGAVMGTRPFPLKRTIGEMGLGEGTVTFTDAGELHDFISLLGDNYREKTFTVTWIKTAPGAPNIKRVCYGCRLLSEPLNDEGGADPLGGDVTFSFMYMTINGKVPHSGLTSPSR